MRVLPSVPHTCLAFVVLREWIEIPFEMEFRCFLVGGLLRGACSYFPWKVEGLASQQGKIADEIQEFITSLLVLSFITDTEFRWLSVS